ncbi:hypothetical protein [Corynebacterium nasicanis]|uniref:DUF4303 domain-containing protein n=1 Tax=Corynebacterium nasicanis TaxID=1448267 RepID=A0ABW1QFL0_9CORY
MEKDFQDLARELGQAIAEVLRAHATAFDGRPVAGLALCPVDDYLVPYLAVVCAEGDAPPEDLHDPWSPEEMGEQISNERLDQATGRTHDLADAWPDEDWDSFGPLLREALVTALGSGEVQEALASIGWDPMLYLYLVEEGRVDRASLATLNPGRQGDPEYRALARLG